MNRSFHDAFVEIFNLHFSRVHRYLNRLSGEPQLAYDLAQEAFMRLYQRGSLPDTPEAWLITVATNLFRNECSKTARRARLLTIAAQEDPRSDPPDSRATSDARDSRRRVRAVIDRLPERERRILLLRAEGYSYRDIAAALGLREASVGTLLARAKRAFLDHYGETSDAP